MKKIKIEVVIIEYDHNVNSFKYIQENNIT